MKIATGLTGQVNKDILDGVMGQLSDGIWENSPRMGKYWRNSHIVMEANEIMIEVPDYFCAIWDCNVGDVDYIKNWFANKIKAVAKEYIKDNNVGEWKRDCQEMVIYYHGDWRNHKFPTIAEAYLAYDILKGRRIA